MSSDELCRRLGIRHPIIQAPMANNVTTPALVSAVCNAGALGSVGAPYYSPAEITRAADEIRALTDKPFALNLFVPAPPPAWDAQEDHARSERVRPVLDAFRRELSLPEAPSPVPASPAFDAQFEAVLRARPAVFSFTIGVLPGECVKALHAQGAFLIGTATTADEAAVLESAGIDAVCAQGAEAGGHRGSFLTPTEDALVGTLPLVRMIVSRVKIPVIAAGGIMDGRGIAAVLSLGAAAAQLGTAFLVCPEAGTAPAHREAILSAASKRTVVTAAFSGRQGRAIANRYTDAFAGHAVPAFPGYLAQTRDVRAAASKQGRADVMQLWAGQGAPLARSMPAAELVETLVRESRGK